MKSGELHDVIHGAESTATQALEIALVGRDGNEFSVFRVDEVYVDHGNGLINIVFDMKKKV